MSITKANILTFVNNNLKRAETDIDVQIQHVLDDLSRENLLEEIDTSQSLVSGNTTLTYPTGYKELVAITLNDGTNEGEPLIKIPGGFKEYRRWMEDETSADYNEPEFYAEFDSKFYLYHPADGAYTATIDYYKYHSQDVETIEFGDQFKKCINFGACFEVACKFSLSRYIAIWTPRYETEKAMMGENRNIQPYIVQG